ncbi:HypC/HybG/HupF family hydrogenase formation chaperone [Roseinatronobacter sp. NSM]|uniref:HypC/HybG/HupF family hydrogenase formation chaperone n=1 Tax=Roseinatronobacter sp. NSM TaxID=3457785 RepID=UPI0040351ADB
MCVGTPMQVVSLNGIAADCTDGTRAETVDLSLVGDVPPGTWLLTHLGCAREVITEHQARQIMAALDGLRALMAGGDLGTAFDDLENRAPTLPPHLQAALDAGHSTA